MPELAQETQLTSPVVLSASDGLNPNKLGKRRISNENPYGLQLISSGERRLGGADQLVLTRREFPELLVI